MLLRLIYVTCTTLWRSKVGRIHSRVAAKNWSTFSTILPGSFDSPCSSQLYFINAKRPLPIMSWRNQGITGSNNIPLGKMRRFGSEAADEERSAVSSPSTFSNGDRDAKRGRSPESASSLPSIPFCPFLLDTQEPTMVRDAARSETGGATRPRTRQQASWVCQQLSSPT